MTSNRWMNSGKKLIKNEDHKYQDELFIWFRTVFVLSLPSDISERTMKFFLSNPHRFHMAFSRIKNNIKVSKIETAGRLNLSQAFVVENFRSMVVEPINHNHFVQESDVRLAFGRLFLNRFENVFSSEFVSYFKKTGQIELQGCIFDLAPLLDGVSKYKDFRNSNTARDQIIVSAGRQSKTKVSKNNVSTSVGVMSVYG